MNAPQRTFDLFSQLGDILRPTGQQLRDAGIKQAIDHANEVHQDWSDKAFEFLVRYTLTHSQFMCEEVREAAKGLIPEPPHTRAWGGVITRAVKSGLIKRSHFQNVKNAAAHCTPASVWIVTN